MITTGISPYEQAVNLCRSYVKENLSVAHVIDGNTWASNGHIAIAFPASYYTPPKHDHKAPPFHDTVISKLEMVPPIDVDVAAAMRRIAHQELRREKVKGDRCESCKGEGYKQCNLGHDHECRSCGGEGYETMLVGPPLPSRNITVLCAYTELSLREVYILLRVAELLEQWNIRLTHCSWRNGPTCFMVGPARVYIMPHLIDHASHRLTPLIPFQGR